MDALIGTQVTALKTTRPTLSNERQTQHRALPRQVWAVLTPEQQQHVFRGLVKVCRSLVGQIDSRSAEWEVRDE